MSWDLAVKVGARVSLTSLSKIMARSIRGLLLMLCVVFITVSLVSPCTARLGWWDTGRGLSEEPKLPEDDESPRESGDDGVPTSSMERGSMYNEWARFTQESTTLDYAPPAANPSHY